MAAMGVRAVPDPPAELPKMAVAVDETIGALGCPASDAAVVALARTVAATIDGMQAGQRGMMLGQTAPLLLKVLQELEDRSRKRRAGSRRGRANPVADMRTAHATAASKRKRTG
jgi:hypothetical protein